MQHKHFFAGPDTPRAVSRELHVSYVINVHLALVYMCVQAKACLSASFMTIPFTILSVALSSADVGTNASRLFTLNHVGTL